MALAELIENIWNWLRSHQSILGWAGLLSLVMMGVTILTVPLIVVSLPSRYLIGEGDGRSHIPALWRWPYLVVKNGIGGILVLGGLAMLILPGQGLLTIVIGLGLMNFPGKRRLIRRLIGQRQVLGAINRLRARAHRGPLAGPEEISGG